MDKTGKKIRKVVGREGKDHPLNRVWRLRQLARAMGISPPEADDGELIRKVVGRTR